MVAGLGIGLTAAAGASARAGRASQTQKAASERPTTASLRSGSSSNQSKTLQHLIDAHAQSQTPIYLPPGTFYVANIELRQGTKLIGAEGLTRLHYAGGETFISGENGRDIKLQGLVFDGQNLGLDARQSSALVSFTTCANLEIRDCTFRQSLVNGISLEGCSGRIENTTVEDVRNTGIFALNSTGLNVIHNDVGRCGDNAIQVWRNTPVPDGTRVSGNRIYDISAKSGGSGQYGNGVNVFRAGNVSVTDNHISDCAYSAVRGNASSNLQILSNSCVRIGEVALYAEFEFEGAMISNNLVSDVASGISVTNFADGGRLATITGNLIRDLKRREFEPVDKRGIGISVEADSVVSGNVIENAPSAGLVLGWGTYRRDLIAAQNIIRNARIGILVAADPNTGPTLITGNLISGSTHGAIRKALLDTAFGPELSNHPDERDGLTITQNVMKNAAG